MLASLIFEWQRKVAPAADSKQRHAFTILELTVALFILVAAAAIVIPITSNVSANAGTDVTRSQLVELRNALTRYWGDVKYATVSNQTGTVFDFATANDGLDFSNVLSVRVLFSNPDLDRNNSVNDIAIFDPSTKIGWHGPYLLNTPSLVSNALASRSDFGPYVREADEGIFDVIHTSSRDPLPIVVQAIWNADTQRIEARVVSAGTNGVIDTGHSVSNQAILAAQGDALTQLVGDDLYEMFTLHP